MRCKGTDQILRPRILNRNFFGNLDLLLDLYHPSCDVYSCIGSTKGLKDLRISCDANVGIFTLEAIDLLTIEFGCN